MQRLGTCWGCFSFRVSLFWLMSVIKHTENLFSWEGFPFRKGELWLINCFVAIVIDGLDGDNIIVTVCLFV